MDGSSRQERLRVASRPDDDCKVAVEISANAAQPAEPWDGVRDSTAEGNVCAQIPAFPYAPGFIGGEDCLFINIYTPTLEGEFLPVMVWSHSGSFDHGSGNADMFGPDFLVEKDVVVVTFNYRMGPLGFLCLNTPEVPGNAGMKDQVLALQWVKENIGSFGGNSGNITVFGEGAGGASSSLLTLSPLSKQLMTKAIFQSGTSLNWFALTQDDPLENARELARNLGCESSDAEEVFNFLQTVPVKELIEAAAKLNSFGRSKFAPVIEKEFPGVEPFLTEHPINILTSGRGAKIPLMIGRAAEEAASYLSSDFIIDEDLRNFIPKAFNIEHNSEKAVELAAALKKFYFSDAHIGMDSLHQYLKLLGDRDFAADIHRYVKVLSQTTNQPVYNYRFSYVGVLNILQKFLESFGVKHAGHNDDLGYLFNVSALSEAEVSPSDIQMRETVVQMWTNFAKTGNPTPYENKLLTVTWLPVTEEHQYYLDIDKELTLATSMDQDRMQLWDDWYSKYYKVWSTPDSPKVDVEENSIKGSPVNAHFEYAQDDSQNDSGITDEVEERKEAEPSQEENNEVILVSTIESEVVPLKEEINEPVVVPLKQETNEPEVAPLKQETNEPEVVPLKEETNEPEVQLKQEPNKPEVAEPLKETLEIAPIQNGKKAEEANSNGTHVVDEELEVIRKIENVLLKEEKMIEAQKLKEAANGGPKDIIRANDPPEDDLPKNIGVNKFVNFFESLGGKKK